MSGNWREQKLGAISGKRNEVGNGSNKNGLHLNEVRYANLLIRETVK